VVPKIRTSQALLRRFRSASSGAAAIEFAIVAPFLIFFVLTMIYFALYLSVASSVLQLAADGARASVAGIGETEREALTADYVSERAEKYFLIDNSRLGVDFTSDAAGGSSTVTITYDAAPLLAWYPISFSPLVPAVVTRAAVVRDGGF
jgi:Flp pilus assembly protein TadG